MKEAWARCPRCLPPKSMTGDLARYVERIPPEEKAEESLYQERLETCAKCEMLLSGMCRVCGCFVQLRAAIASQSCPKGKPLWERAQGEDVLVRA